jgi:phosphate transport system protein
MGSEAQDNLDTAVAALMKRNTAVSQQIIEADQWFNEIQLRITMDSLKLIATQQPAASDLRFIASVMGIANELERIHDYIKGIGKVSLLIDEDPIPEGILTQFPLMAEKAKGMLNRAINAFAMRDLEAARKIPRLDDEVDELYNIIYRNLAEFIMKHPQEIDDMHRLDWANHNLERLADRVSNICEWIVYMITGDFSEFS